MEHSYLEVVGAVFSGDSQGEPAVLAFRRAADRSAGGKWEFPGGKVEPTETQPSALVREIREELGIKVSVGGLVARASTEVDGRVIDLACYWATANELPTASSDHDAIRWVTVSTLHEVDWAEPDLPAVEAIEAILGAEIGVSD
ncbi:(deoxy)nucleoside triphosphate pyrophosphohydrolase [Brevibacterium sp. H602]|uniref:(deoxy)nucleoside triphosphate pyrophosphohydrolase n=1 Tax=unclassified Brevibacterium TaxID=2614124 RepID=UPI00397A6DC2